MRKGGALAVVLLAGFAVVGCSHKSAVETRSKTVVGVDFIPAPRSLLGTCRRTARRAGYAVPCPTAVPRGLVPHSSGMNCRLSVIGPTRPGDCGWDDSWRGWVVGSGATTQDHLVITAAPLPLDNAAKLVNGPAWYPLARVRPLGRMTINGWNVRAVYVTPATNDGSAFAGHVVLIWTVSGHTYGIGFHTVGGIKRTLALDRALAAGVKLTKP